MPDSNRKSYFQVCPLASALDYIGDRWTLLILRELLGGSARFNELRDGLPGIATNLLAERLQRLEADELVRRIDARNTVLYALTESGARIRPVLEELGFWGASMVKVAPPKYQRSIRAIAMALQAILVRAGEALPAERTVLELEVEGEYIEIVLDQRPGAIARLSMNPDARARISAAGMAAILRGQMLDEAPLLHISGEESVTMSLLNALGLTP